MIDKKTIILEFMKDENYTPMKAKEIAMILGVPKKEYNKFAETLKQLEENFQIVKNKKNRYRLIGNNYKQGVYRKNQKGFGFVKIENEEDEIYISKENCLNALNGDIVLVEILEEKNKIKNAEGIIKKIIKHEKNTVVGTFQKNDNFGFVVPDDRSLGTDIFISKNNFGKARNGHKVLVEIIKYPERGKNAEGKVIEVLGSPNQAGVDMLSLIKEYNLPSTFPEQVVEEAKKYGNKIDEKDIPNRIDCRSHTIFTIDGEDAKDLDDAIRVTKLENGNYRLDVHIADVSYYVKEGSLLDREAQIRGTSIYMLSRVIPMLPRELSNGLCSLNAGEDRFTLSCSMEINNKGKLISTEVYKGIINVTERMNYHDVQKILDKSDKQVLKKYEKYINDFKLMEELALILKNRRLEQGYLNLDIPESKIELDKEGFAIGVGKYETSFSNEIIEQFMLSANEAIAEKFYWLEAPFIYRVHEAPEQEKISELNTYLYNFGYKIKGSKDNIHPKAFSTIIEDIKGRQVSYQKEFLLTNMDIIKPTIEVITTNGSNIMTIIAKDETEIAYISYQWDDEEQPTYAEATEQGQKEIRQPIEMKLGTRTIKIIAEDISGNVEQLEKEIIASTSKPKVALYQNGAELKVEIQDNDGIKDVEININGEVKSAKNINLKHIKVGPVILKEGNNVINIKVTNISGYTGSITKELQYTP